MPLISLKPGKSKAFCENRFCNKRLLKAFKILRRGLKGYAFNVCMGCYNLINKKGGPDKYLPGREIPDLKVVGPVTYSGLHDNEHARLKPTLPQPYIPLGTHAVGKPVEIAQNPRTGQIML